MKYFKIQTLVLSIVFFLSGCGNFFFPPDLGLRDQEVNVPEMVEIPAITGFMMGSTSGGADEQPVHAVNISAFSIGKYEVTVEEFVCFLNSGAYDEYYESWPMSSEILRHSAGVYEVVYGKERFPIRGVSWYAAEAYCDWLAKETGEQYRLPSEAEWEYAAVGNAGTRIYPWGDTWDSAKCNIYSGGPVEVGFYESGKSLFGLYDMAGNVWEWCSDWYGSAYYSSSSVDNPQGPGSGTYKVLRGGSWGDVSGLYLRCADRYNLTPGSRYYYIGFRVARTF